MLRDFAERAFDLDQGLLYTIRALTTDLGLTSRNYVEGLRRPYVNPLGYLIQTVALSVVVINAIGDTLLEVLLTPYIKLGTDAPFAGEMTAVEFYETLIAPSILWHEDRLRMWFTVYDEQLFEYTLGYVEGCFPEPD